MNKKYKFIIKIIFISISVLISLYFLFKLIYNFGIFSGNMVYNKYIYIDEFAVCDYLDYDKIFVNEKNNLKNEERYSPISKDKEIDWYRKMEFDSNDKVLQMHNQVSLNGKKVKLPCKFKDIDEKYSSFDKISTNDYKNNKNTTIYISKKSGYGLENYGDYKEYDNLFFGRVFNEKKEEFEIYLEPKYQSLFITHLKTELSYSNSNLKVGNIGIGNTFNEVYEEFGTPTSITKFSDDTWWVEYEMDLERNSIIFVHSSFMKNPLTQKKEKVYPTVITSIMVNGELK